ncbi:MAG: hypothetical protein LBG60_14350, partial [Bifidobacteriaceae bacterium]|nr:hypothetical protein [Bifidobacteriaceae bacterium]
MAAVAAVAAGLSAVVPAAAGTDGAQPEPAPCQNLLAGHFNNVGVTASDNRTPGNFDGRGNSYSGSALAAAGVSPGAELEFGGFCFVWPETAASGTPDNVQGAGQVVDLPASASKIGFLVAAIAGGSGTATVTYTNGTTQFVPLDVPTWLGTSGDPVIAVQGRNTQAAANADTAYTYRMFLREATLEKGKTPATLTLPNVSALHFFALATVTGAGSSLPDIPAYTGPTAIASGVTLPGLPPGEPEVVVEQDGGLYTVALDNAVLGATFQVGADGAALTRLENKQTLETASLTTREFFSMTLADGTVLTSSCLTQTSPPALRDVAVETGTGRLADQVEGQAVTTVFRCEAGDVDFDLVWTVELRTDGNTIEQFFAIAPVDGDLAYKSTTLLDVTLAGARISGRDDGSPVVAGWESGSESFFFGIENPLSKPVVAGDQMAIALRRANPVALGETQVESTGIGVSLPGQMRRSFGYYVERERASSRHTFLHYQSYYDGRRSITSAQMVSRTHLFGTELSRRDAKLDSVWVDDGWDYSRDPRVADESNLNVWSFDPTKFPDKFMPLMEAAGEYGASVSAWMSPFGGYHSWKTNRLALNASKPEAERYEVNSGGFSLAGPKYYAAFRAAIFDMIDNQGVRGFKLDGVGGGLYQTGPNETYLADYENLLKLLREIKEHNPDVWINTTTGSYSSPYFLWYMDSIWRDGADAWGGTQTNATNRDAEIYQNFSVEAPLFPVSSLMHHGFIWSSDSGWANTDLSKLENRRILAQALKSYLGLGPGLQELYIESGKVAPGQPYSEYFWDVLAANAKWARANEMLLTDSHLVGPKPSASGGVYGNAAWNAEDGGQGILMLRNPANAAGSFTIDPAAVFELPDGYGTRYKLVERDGMREDIVADSDAPYTVALEPYEVLIFEAAPTDEPTAQRSAAAAAGPNRVERLFDNVGVTSGVEYESGDFDGQGNSYSAEQLAGYGLVAGEEFSIDGLTFTWPAAAGTGQPDNLVADGQAISFEGSGTRLGFLLASSGD